MENKDYQENAGCFWGILFICLLAAVSFIVSGKYIGAAVFAALMIFAAVKLYGVRNDYILYKSFRRRIKSKSVREQLVYILSHSGGDRVYLHYGTREEFERFQEYVKTLSKEDELWDDFTIFLEEAEKYNRLT